MAMAAYPVQPSVQPDLRGGYPALPWAVALPVAGLLLVATVAAPLATYTGSLALFGLAHVLSELNYIDRRFSARLGTGLLWAICLPIGVAVAARIAATLAVLPPGASATIELASAAALALAAARHMRRFRLLGGAAGLAMGASAAAAPAQLLLALALLHNLTPLGFFAEALESKARRRALIPLALVLIGLPAVIATGIPRTAMQAIGLFLPWAGFPGSGPLILNLGLFVPSSLLASDWAIDWFSAAVFAQLMHYGAVIALLPRLARREAA